MIFWIKLYIFNPSLARYEKSGWFITWKFFYQCTSNIHFLNIKYRLNIIIVYRIEINPYITFINTNYRLHQKKKKTFLYSHYFSIEFSIPVLNDINLLCWISFLMEKKNCGVLIYFDAERIQKYEIWLKYFLHLILFYSLVWFFFIINFFLYV